MKKTKNIVVLFLILLLCMAPMDFVSAAGDLPRLVDWADLLSDDEETELLNKLDEISERQQVDIVVLTIDSLGGESVVSYADDFYDFKGYGYGAGHDGILFLISMEERDWYISTAGYGITALTDAGMGYMSEEFLPYLSDGEYAEAFSVFADLCDEYITQARKGVPYDTGNAPKEPFGFARHLAIDLPIAFVIALIVTVIMYGQLKTVHSQSGADGYVADGGLRLSRRNDLFLYRNVTRRERPKESSSGSSHRSGGSSTHRSSSGRSHGGRGGKF